MEDPNNPSSWRMCRRCQELKPDGVFYPSGHPYRAASSWCAFCVWMLNRHIDLILRNARKKGR